MTKFEQDRDVKYFWIFPYRWRWRETFRDVWNPSEPRVFPPKRFGVGWGLNLHAISKKLSPKKK